MKRSCISFFVIVLLAAAWPVSAQQRNIAANPFVASNLALLETWIEAHRAYSGQPGIAVGIVYDNDLIYAKGFGYADVEKKIPCTPNTIFRIASHSKMFTSIALMQLRDQGKLDLDDPVKKHLPWFTIQNTFPDAPPVTIRHLLTHTSGLPREAGSAYWLDFDFPAKAQIVERLANLQTVYPPDTRWKYSNLALALAGEIVVAVSGQSYEDYVTKNTLEPLNMQDASVVFPAGKKDRLATGYGRRMPDGTRAVLPFVDAKGMAAATGLSCTVTDMAKFISWQFRLTGSNKTEVLKASTLREMHHPQWVEPDWKSGWGIGFSILHGTERDLVGHGGGYPGYRTSTYYCSKEKIGVIVFTNSGDAEPYPGYVWSVSDRIFEWVAPAIKKAANGETGPKTDPSWARLEGVYRSLTVDTQVLVLDGKLAMVRPFTPNPKAGALTLEPAGKDTFRIEGSGDGPLGELVTFEFGPDGRANKIIIGVNPSARASY
ncbi:MAG: serine hydrolase domain-containing protein [Candidatus Latescibacterota bacterium]